LYTFFIIGSSKTLKFPLCFKGKSRTLGDDGRRVGGPTKCQVERFREIPVSRKVRAPPNTLYNIINRGQKYCGYVSLIVKQTKREYCIRVIIIIIIIMYTHQYWRKERIQF